MGLDKIKEKFLNEGIEVKDIPKAIGIFLGISFVWIGVLWSFCYVTNPSKLFLKIFPLNSLKKAFESPTVKNSNALNYITTKLSGKAAISFGEMLAIKSLVAPVSLPLKIWLT